MNAKKFIQPLFYLLLLVTLLGATSCRLGRRATPTPIPITLPSQLTPDASTFTTYTVQKGEVVQEELLTGRVIPAREEDLFFRRSGRVTAVYVDDGTKVQSGDIIAVLDNELLELDLESAMIGLAIAKENLTNAQNDLAYRRRQAELSLSIAQVYLDDAGSTASITQEGLNEPSLVKVRRRQAELAQLNLDNVDETVDPRYELEVKRAELSVDRVKQAILEGQIVAPFDGEIRFINLPEKDEQLAVPGYSAVARLVDTSKLRVELNLPRAQLENLTEGMAVSVGAASLGGRTLPGVIEALPRPFGTSQGSLTEVSLGGAGDSSLLREGITVAVNVRLKSKPNALVLPLAALQQEDQLYYVTIQEGEVLRRVNIAVGVMSGDLAEIIAGVENGDTVVVAPQKK